MNRDIEESFPIKEKETLVVAHLPAVVIKFDFVIDGDIRFQEVQNLYFNTTIGVTEIELVNKSVSNTSITSIEMGWFYKSLGYLGQPRNLQEDILLGREVFAL